MSFFRTAICLALAGVAASGCTSIKSQLLTRDEVNQNWEVRKLDGMPITVSVPTHVRVTIVETRYLRDGKELSVRGRDVIHDVINTKKVFTVDFKRPAAGYLKYNAQLNDEQYFKSIGSELQDTTISDVSLALQRVLPLLQRPATPGAVKEVLDTPAIIPVKSVEAVGLFEIDDPMFEQNVQAFLSSHLDYAGVEVIHVPPGAPAGQATPLMRLEPTPAPAAHSH